MVNYNNNFSIDKDNKCNRRQHMKKRADGRFSSQIYLGVVDGKRKYKTVYGTTQKEVKQKVAELKIKIGKGVDISAADETFKTWADRFVLSKKAEGIGNSHYQNLNNFCNHLHEIHNKPLSSITSANIQSIIDNLALYHDGGKAPLSKRSLTGVKQFASQVYKMAIGARAVEYNPAEYVKIPKNASVTHRTAITEEQQKWIVDTPHRAQRAAMIMLYSGVRRGELLALTWKDINFKESTITVNKAVEFINNQPHIKEPKTQAGNRIVEIPQNLVDYLKAEFAQDRYTQVIHQINGKVCSQISFRRMWESYINTLAKKYGDENIPFETFTPHQLRHTFCTLLYAAEYSLMEAKNQMGHSDIKTTANIYTHLDKVSNSNRKGKLTKYLCKSNASQKEKKA